MELNSDTKVITNLRDAVLVGGALLTLCISATLVWSDMTQANTRLSVVETSQEKTDKVISRIDKRLYRLELERGIKDAEPLVDEDK